jgi:hypothetical protein
MEVFLKRFSNRRFPPLSLTYFMADEIERLRLAPPNEEAAN